MIFPMAQSPHGRMRGKPLHVPLSCQSSFYSLVVLASATISGSAGRVAGGVAVDLGAAGVDVDDDIAKITVVGAGMKPESGVAARMFRILSDHGINIEMISTSPIRISCVVRGGDYEAALVALHDGFISQNETQEGT